MKKILKTLYSIFDNLAKLIIYLSGLFAAIVWVIINPLIAVILIGFMIFLFILFISL